eukprot:gene58408-77929_t
MSRNERRRSMAEFAGKVALVTGTTGIGRAVALRLCAGGASVMALGIDEAGNAALAEEGVTVRRTDVSIAQDVGAAVGEAVDRFGGLDIIVNSAAVHSYGDAVSTSPEVFAQCMAVNVGSIHLTAHFAVPLMRRRGGGVIVNIASVQGHACQAGI